MASLAEKLLKNTTLKQVSSVLNKSEYFGNDEFAKTDIPMLNVALSGDVNGGLPENSITVVAGPSKHFKSNYGLTMVSAYLNKYEDAVCLFYDSEFGSKPQYFENASIDTSRVIHTPVKDIEEFKFDIVTQLDNIEKGDKVIVFIDSLGNLASKKELDDTLDKKATVDMTRAKQIKSLFRMITPYANLKNIPIIVINHTYQDISSIYAQNIVSGGCVVKDTKIMMDNGSFKSIQDITIGEYVMTLQGPCEVTHTWNPDTLEDGTPECYEIEFEDGYKVICSDRHRFLVDGAWIDARNLLVDTKVTTIKQI